MIVRKALHVCVLLIPLSILIDCQQDGLSKRNVQSTIELKVFEENSTNSEIFDLSNYYKFSKNRPIDRRQEVKLKFRNPEWTNLMTFDEESQKFFVAQRLDRETLCLSSSEKCVIRVDVQIDGQDTLRMDIEIIDINDHLPEFIEKNYEVHVSELSQPGIIFQFPPAVDLDVGANSDLGFAILPKSSPFQLEVERNSLNKIVDLRLVLTGELDRETRSSYRLVVLATDSGTPSLTGSTVVIVHIDDENDNQPVFEHSQYVAEVRPDDAVGHSVLTVRATDRDEDIHARIKYYFPKKTASIYGRLFSIDKDTGEIKLISKVSNHRNFKSPMQLFVFAENFGPNEIPTSTGVLINIVNVNSHAPIITVDSPFKGSDSDNLIVDENNVPNFILGKVIVHDTDVGDGGLVDCKVKEKTSYDLKRLDSNSFQLSVKEPMDRELEGSHKINVDCEDMGNPPLLSSLEINLIVIDVDDNPPRFIRQTYQASIDENNAVGAPILTLEIEDLDADPRNNKCDFFVEPHYEHLFRVDRTTGTLIALVSFDREQSDRYSFHVFAKGGKVSDDNSSYKHVARTLVNLTILDIDDELPRFEQPWFKFAVTENMSGGSVVGKVKAIDPDLPPNNLIQYSLLPLSSSNLNFQHLGQEMNDKPMELPFGIEPLSGMIFTKVPLDSEQHTRYEFNVFVRNDSTSVFIDVIDLNDNPPGWIHPRPESCASSDSLFVKGNLTFAQSLDTIVAKDADSGENGKIVYQIISGNEFGQFSLDAKSGKLSWNSYFSGLKQQNQCQTKLIFKAHDLGTPQFSSETSCLDVIFEECIAHLERLQHTSPQSPKELVEVDKSKEKGNFSDLYIIIIVAVLLVCVIVSVVLTAVICITRQQTRALKREKFGRGDLRASLPLTGPDNEAVLVLDRSSTNESSDQLTGILVSLRSAEQLGRLQLRNMAPSKDSLMSTSISFHRERDSDSGYADVSPV